jgi:hypothetical protein
LSEVSQVRKLKGSWDCTFSTCTDDPPSSVRELLARWEPWEEMEIVVHAYGYYDEGRVSGPAELCYPPEGEDCREVEAVYLYDRAAEGELRMEVDEAIRRVLETVWLQGYIDTLDLPPVEESEAPEVDKWERELAAREREDECHYALSH